MRLPWLCCFSAPATTETEAPRKVVPQLPPTISNPKPDLQTRSLYRTSPRSFYSQNNDKSVLCQDLKNKVVDDTCQKNKVVDDTCKKDVEQWNSDLILPKAWANQIDPRKEINASNKYTWIRQVGHGSFGLVALAEETADSVKSDKCRQVVIKILSRRDLVRARIREGDIEMKRVVREICHHKALSGHPNIIEFKEVFLTRNFLCIVMEYADGGDMFDYGFGYKIPENIVRRQFQHLVRAMCHCHSRNIVHRDLKLENCLMASTSSNDPCAASGPDNMLWTLKLCDFGYTKHLELDGVASGRVGSMPYASPEVVFARPQDVYDGMKRDIWALGVLLYILLVNRYPFDPARHSLLDLCKKIKWGNYRFPSDLKISEDVKDLIAGLLNPDPQLRFTLKEIVNHKWMQEDLPLNWDWYTTNIARTEGWGEQSDEEIKRMIDLVFRED